MAESKEELKSLLKVKEESENASLKLNIQKMKIMAFGPITWCQIDGETMETVTEFIFLGSKVTVDSDCSHEIKRCLFFGIKAMTNLKSESTSVLSNSLQTHGLYSPWNSLGQNTGVGSLSLLQGIFPTRNWTGVSRIAGRFSTSWATREAQRNTAQHSSKIQNPIDSMTHYFEGCL